MISRVGSRVGIVVPNKDEAQTLGTCLRALRAQAADAGAIVWVVVVDNGSTDGSRQLAHELADEVLDLPGASIAAMRNTGARLVRDGHGVDVVGFVDADCEVLPGWLAAGLRALEDADLVGARTAAADGDTWVARRWAAIEAARAHEDSLVWSQHLLVRAETFGALGGFDETLRTGEDADLSARLRARGGRVALVPEMRVVHHGFPSTLRRFVRREVWHTSTPGWFARMAPKSRALVVGSGAWAAVGVTAATRATATRSAAPVSAWALVSLAGIPALGLTGARSARHSAQDGVLLSVWSLVRAARLPQELRTGAPR